jgi:hypothetical protein
METCSWTLGNSPVVGKPSSGNASNNRRSTSIAVTTYQFVHLISVCSSPHHADNLSFRYWRSLEIPAAATMPVTNIIVSLTPIHSHEFALAACGLSASRVAASW